MERGEANNGLRLRTFCRFLVLMYVFPGIISAHRSGGWGPVIFECNTW